MPNILSTAPSWPFHVSLAATKESENPVAPGQASMKIRVSEKDRLDSAFAKFEGKYGGLPGCSKRLSPHPLLLPKKFVQDLQKFHEALSIALDNLVDRWWIDIDAALPDRMPIDSRAEGLLKVRFP